ncbi:DNA polymerase III subunit alpha [Buchnera aphidicola (Tuberolachnus salignus)]|uniref:DNA polymerase III subunit alpha n=1 Tax=Buchnera aphidicola subsp. Tuberolachnus salignus TaxID=98804 RepID=A0A160SVX8_BUCTT|nr:DNA polymerase III subunit alpha [Buchnera aphidicola]CUR53137.1 DNA polymerase III subunit alpha [Buchnera aphidicola (Tuberolachnus salignus)]
MKKVNFVHLRTHSDYSMIDGLAKPSSLVKQAVFLDMVALGLTDINNLYGVIKFYNVSRSLGIKPIIGIDITILSDIIQNYFFRITLLAMNQTGYKNIIFLLSTSYQKGYPEDIGPSITLKDLIKYREGLIVLSGGLEGDIGKCILCNDFHLIQKNFYYFKKYFKNSYFLEIYRINDIREEEYLHKIKYVSKKFNLPLIVTHPVSFLKKKDFKVHKIRIAIHQRKTITDSKFLYSYTQEQFLKSEQEMCDLFSDFPDALKNSVEIAKRCNVIIPTGQYFLPNFDTKSIKIYDFFKQKISEGLEERLVEIFPNKLIRSKLRKKYDSRLCYEVSIIKKMGFISYFLIVMEFIMWAKNNDIPVGPGRGSGSGSLVAFVLKITELDPIKFGLLFERFLNPDRVSLPDFDIDFCMEKRDLVIEHVTEKYGRNSVAQIITFGTMAAKAVIRDVGRVLGYPYGFINRISKLVPLDPGMTLKKAFSKQKELISLYQEDSNVKILIDMAKKLEGIVRNVGKHAGGVVISPTIISDFSPLYCDSNGQNQVTQFDKNDIEYVGLVKFDFLGLKTLTIIDSCVKMINKKKKYNKKKIIDINKINLFDKKSFKLLRKSDTIAVFQLESKGMQDLIRRLKPDTFEDLIALVALFRPGPLQAGMVDNFINRKQGYEKISYPDEKWQHKTLKPILKSTYGIVLYQEQVMNIAQILAKYTPGQADILRRAMGKKDPKEMSEQRHFFEMGAKKNGICTILANKIFNLLEKFAAYGFNKSHSATYAFLSYQTLWLKSNYPEEFFASALNMELSNTNKIVILIQDIKKRNLKINPPDINRSNWNFFVDSDKTIIYGLGAIKGLGKSSIKIIESVRCNGQKPFKNFLDLCIRTFSKHFTRRVFERLIMSGACDSFKICRSKLFKNITYMMKIAKQYVVYLSSKQTSLFGTQQSLKNIFFKKKNCVSIKQQIKNFLNNECHYFWEKETLGFYFTGHPISIFLKELLIYTNGICLKDCLSKRKNKYIVVSGLIESVKIKLSTKKKKIYSLVLDDSCDTLDVVFFDIPSNVTEKILKRDVIVVVSGILQFDTFKNCYRVVAKRILDLETVRNTYIKKINIIILFDILLNEDILNFLFELFKKNNFGSIIINFFYSHRFSSLHPLFCTVWKLSMSNKIFRYLLELENLKYLKLKY